MLPKTYRFISKNETGQTLTYDSGARITLTYELWKFDANGAVVYSVEQSEDFGFGAGDTLAANGIIAGSTVDNSTNLYIGLKGVLEITTDHASTAGAIELYLDVSTDGGTDWASDNVANPDTGDEIGGSCIPLASTVAMVGAETEAVAVAA